MSQQDENLHKGRTSCILSSTCFLSIQSAHSYSLIYTSSNDMTLKKTIAEILSNYRQGTSQPERLRHRHVRDKKHQCEPRGPDPRCGVRLLREADGYLLIGSEGEGVGPAGEWGVGLLC